MDVYVFVFRHRHGRDITVHATAELAIATAARVARNWWSEARERDPSLPEGPPARDSEAMEMYFEAQDGYEFYEIASCEVEGSSATVRSAMRVPPGPSILRFRRARLVRRCLLGLRRRRREAEVPVARRVDCAGAVELLFKAAYDSELTMLDELVERAGLGWRCRADVAGFPCHHMNVGTATCWGCGADEEEGKEDPDG